MDSLLSQPSRLRLSRINHTNVNEFSMPGPSIASSRFSDTNSDAPRQQQPAEDEERPVDRLRDLLRRMPSSPPPSTTPKRKLPSEPDLEMNESDFERVSVSLAAQPSMAQESLKELFGRFKDTTPRKPAVRRRNSVDTSDFETPAKPKSRNLGKQKSASDDEVHHTDEDLDESISNVTSRATVFNNLREQLNQSQDSNSLRLPPVASSTPHKPSLAQSTSHFQFGPSRSNLLGNHSSMAFALKDMTTFAERTEEEEQMSQRPTTPRFNSSADEITDHLLSEAEDDAEESPQKRHQRSSRLSHPMPTHPSFHYESSIDEISNHLLQQEEEPESPVQPDEQHGSSVDEISTHLLSHLEPEEETASPEASRQRRVSFGKVQSWYDNSAEEISEHLLSDAEEEEDKQNYMQTPKSSRHASAKKPRISALLRRESTSSVKTPVARRVQPDRLSTTPSTTPSIPRRRSPTHTPSPVPRPASSTPVSASRVSETPAGSQTPTRSPRLSSSNGLTPRPSSSLVSPSKETPTTARPMARDSPITTKPFRPPQNTTSPASISTRAPPEDDPESLDESLSMDLEDSSFVKQNASEDDTRSRSLAQTRDSMSLTGVVGGPIESTRMDFSELKNWHRNSFEKSQEEEEEEEEEGPASEIPTEAEEVQEVEHIPPTADDEPMDTPPTARVLHRRSHTRGSSLLKELQQATANETGFPLERSPEPSDNANTLASMPSFNMSEDVPHPTIQLPDTDIDSDRTPEQMDHFQFPATPAALGIPSTSTFKTPAPPGAFLPTPYHSRTIPAPKTPGLRTAGSLSMMKTPAPPGAYVATPRAGSMPAATPSYVERTYTAFKTPRPPGAWAGTPAPAAWKAKSSRLGATVRFDDEEPKSESVDDVDFGEAVSSTPPMKSPTSSKIYYVDSMGRQLKQEVDEGFSEEEETSGSETEMEDDLWVPPRDRHDAAERLKAGLAELKTEFGGMEEEIKLNSRMETKDIHHWKALAEASMISRHNREKLEAQLVEAQKRTDREIAKSRRWFNMNMPMFWLFALIQIVIVYLIYRMSSSHTRLLFLTNYYDPFYANIHLNIFRSSAYPHPFTQSLLSIYDILVAGYWHAALLELRGHLGLILDTLLGVMGLHGGEALTLRWPPT